MLLLLPQPPQPLLLLLTIAQVVGDFSQCHGTTRLFCNSPQNCMCSNSYVLFCAHMHQCTDRDVSTDCSYAENEMIDVGMVQPAAPPRVCQKVGRVAGEMAQFLDRRGAPNRDFNVKRWLS